MSTAEILAWLEAQSVSAEKEGRRIAAKTYLEAADELRKEIKRRNAANWAALNKRPTQY